MANPVFRRGAYRPIPAEVLRRIVEAAHLSASSVNLQPWHFVLVTSRETLRELGALMRTGRYIADAGAAVVVAYESMVLVAWAEGVGSNWTGFGGLESVRKMVGMPDSFEVLAVVPFGYPKRTLGKGKKKRKPLASVVSAERFGTPFV